MAKLISGGGGGTNYGSISSIMDDLQNAQNKANAANQQRATQGMADINGAYGKASSLYGAATGDLSGMGQAEGTRIDRNLQNNLGTASQNMINRGIGNSSITESVDRGFQDDAELQHEGVNEQVGRMQSQLATQQAGFETQHGQDQAGFLERQNDIGPDPSLYASLIRGASGANQQPVQGGTVVNPYGSPTSLQPFNPTTGGPSSGPGSLGGGGGGNMMTSTHSTGGGSSGGGGYYNGGGGGGGGGGAGGGGGVASGGGGGGWNIPQGGFSNSIDSLPGGGGSPITSAVGGGGAGEQTSAATGADGSNQTGLPAGGQYSYGDDGWIGYQAPDGSWTTINPGRGGQGGVA